MAVFKINGRSESGVPCALPTLDLQTRVRDSVRVEATFRDDVSTVDLNVGTDDLLEVELENGFVLWTTIDRLQADTEEAGMVARGGATLPAQYPLQKRGTERGAVGEGIRALRVVGIDLPRNAARRAAAKIEATLEGDGQFFRLDANGRMTREDPAPTPNGEPTLVLVHGTFSSTQGGYGGLFKDNVDIWRELLDHYDGRVFGFDHKTLSKSPLDNAAEFLSALPQGLNLHLVTHSRGGLVGDLVAHGGLDRVAFAREDLERELGRAFGKQPDLLAAELQRYETFNSLIADKSPKVTRYVRVGCPAAGTSLASKRLDVYLSVLIHLLGKVPGVGPLLGGLGELVAAFAKQRTKIDVLPGLQAQMPDSPFVRLLNTSANELTSDLTVLAGDSDGLLKNLANLFYWRANDLVVDTRSMYGGAPRVRRWWYLEENRHVTHMNYFSRPETARVVQRGLMRKEGEKAGFNLRKPRGVARGAVDAGAPDNLVERPCVILLPGIMGSNLSVTDRGEKNRVWLDKLDLVRGRGRWLSLEHNRRVVADSVLDSPYGSFRHDLVRHQIHVLPMAYDWRLSLEQSADQLHRLVTARLRASQAPLHLVAHSMGGLVASLYMHRHPRSWARFRSHGGRLVQAGTPNHGSYSIPRIFQGEEQVLKMIALLDLDNDTKDWLGWIARFPGILELAPSFGDVDFSLVSSWRKLGARVMPRSADLRAAATVRQTLVAQSERLAEEGVLYVAGGPEDTPVFDPDSDAIRFTRRGDGRVTWDTIPSDLPTWYLPVKHGDLLDARSGFDALRELIFDGHTSKLSQEPPFASTVLRGQTLEQPLLAADDAWECIPSQEALEGAAVGMAPEYVSSEPAPEALAPCRVSIVHGDLRFSDRPLMVGHYRGDPIVHAEGVLCDCLDGALRARHQLGVYPGDAGTADVVLGQQFDDPRPFGPTGAIVVGLGNVGELSPGKLNRSVEVGLLRLAQAVRERGNTTGELKISALLVGTNEVGITTTQALDAILSAVVSVNRALRATTPDETQASGTALRIADLEFVELYEDIALDALHALAEFTSRQGLRISRTLQRRGGGQRRARTRIEQGWWSRVQIRSFAANNDHEPADDQHRLVYTVYGDRARAPISDVVVQRPLIDRLVDEAIYFNREGDTALPEALFELLVPPAFKPAASDRRNVQLVLDPASAVYPWELLIDRHQDSEQPIGLGVGLLRQLRVERPSAVSYPEDNRIMVVGDPPSTRVPLPGAVAEATTVADLFNRRPGWDVVRRIRDEQPPLTASSIIEGLLAHDHRILHLAGHGEYDRDQPTRSGMIIGGARDGELFISAAEVRQMRMPPELVFINCCHLGRIEETPPLHKLAASLAQAFIEAGAKAVIAAGWPVEDQAAQAFCLEFYRSMLNGDDFGTAVNNARGRTREYDSNTWGAYQCYGDSGFRLLMDQGVRRVVAGEDTVHDRFGDVCEARVALGNFISRARVANSDALRLALIDDIRTLWARCERAGWLDEAGVIVGFARAYAEVHQFERSIELYEQADLAKPELDETIRLFEQAIGQRESGVTLHDLEQLANLRVRSASEIGPVRSALREIDRLVRNYGATGERLSLRGSALKRIASIQSEDREVRLGELRHTCVDMTRAYSEAAALREEDWCYPATNALLGVTVLGGPWQRAPRIAELGKLWQHTDIAAAAAFEELAAEVGTALTRTRVTNFWQAVGSLDLEVTLAIADRSLEKSVSTFAQRYVSVCESFGSEREIDSVVSHWQLIARVLRRLRQRKAADALGKLVEALLACSR